jgi:hypothetical protein
LVENEITKYKKVCFLMLNTFYLGAGTGGLRIPLREGGGGGGGLDLPREFVREAEPEIFD